MVGWVSVSPVVIQREDRKSWSFIHLEKLVQTNVMINPVVWVVSQTHKAYA